MKLNTVPTTVLEAKAKQQLLTEKKVPHVVLAQGLLTVPPASAEPGYNAYLESKGLNPKDLPLSTIQASGQPGEVYNSPRVEELWQQYGGYFRLETTNALQGRAAEAFGTTIFNEISADTIHHLFQLDPEKLATMQVNDMQGGLDKIRSIVAHLSDGNYASQIVLPAQHRYAGYDEFIGNAQLVGGDIEMLSIPEIQPDGSQDFEAMRSTFEQLKANGKVAIMIDQEMNNNASGYDRDPKHNNELADLLEKYAGTVYYVGDIAYKGMKEEGLTEPYPLMQLLSEREITALYYFSASKLTCYRKPPSFRNIVFATPGKQADTERLRQSFDKSRRAPGGIGCTDQGAILMNMLVKDPEFHKEIDTLRNYLGYILNAIDSDTSGIFRCMDPQTIQKLNSGSPQAITIGPRESVWPLGDPTARETYNKALT